MIDPLGAPMGTPGIGTARFDPRMMNMFTSIARIFRDNPNFFNTTRLNTPQLGVSATPINQNVDLSALLYGRQNPIRRTTPPQFVRPEELYM